MDYFLHLARFDDRENLYQVHNFRSSFYSVREHSFLVLIQFWFVKSFNFSAFESARTTVEYKLLLPPAQRGWHCFQ